MKIKNTLFIALLLLISCKSESEKLIKTIVGKHKIIEVIMGDEKKEINENLYLRIEKDGLLFIENGSESEAFGDWRLDSTKNAVIFNIVDGNFNVRLNLNEDDTTITLRGYTLGDQKIFYSFKFLKETKSKQSSSISNIDKNQKDNKFSELNIDKLVENYLLNSDTSKIRFTNSLDCESKENIELYYKEILTYSIDEIKKLKFNYNDDRIDDYIISYTASNCWQGNGAGNYLSNYIFACSNNNKLEINEELTKSFKDNFAEYINRNYGNDEYKYVYKTQFINGIDFQFASDETVSGVFNINTNKCVSAQPCISGRFDFNTKTRKIDFNDLKNADQ